MVMATRVRNEAKERKWRGHVTAWRASGVGIREYCRRHQLSEPNFHAWRREIARRDELAGVLTTEAKRAKPSSVTWMPVMVTPATSPLVEVQLPGGTVLRVPAGVESMTLERILTALHQVPSVQEARP